ncbi:MAG: CvpA family protein [Oscillospiraceae bacterium]|nr:CvpA family protein [Oscillospiraceae bacterium]
MIRLILDIVLLLIVALCTWSGYRKGLIGGIAGILVVVIALFGGSLLSSAYSREVVPVLEPFVDGYIDSQNTRDDILEKLNYGYSDLSLEDVLARDSSLRYKYAEECMKTVGIYQDRAEEMAVKAVETADRNGVSMTEAVVSVLCDTASFVGGLTVAFLLILILLVAIGNIGNLSFRLPNLELLDEIGGAVLGFVKGFLYCVLLCWLLSFLGLIIGRDTIEDSALAQFFLQIKFLTSGLL